MENIQLYYTSWCNTKGHDKVWGYFYLGESKHGQYVGDLPMFVFYGARGKSLQIKEHVYGPKLISLRRSKESKGYKSVPTDEFLDICPNFYQEVDNKLTFAILGGNKYKAAS